MNPSVICNGFEGVIQIQPYRGVIRDKFIDATFARKFNPKKLNNNSITGYFEAFERLTNEQYERAYEKMIDEVVNLSKESLKDLLKSAFHRCER